MNIEALGELTLAQFDQNKHLIRDEVSRRRAKHAVSENERTKLARKVLAENDFEQFGKLLNMSHASLKEDYEVTGIELDTLAETAQQVNGVLGARMTGAGFAGCAIALVHKDSIELLEHEVSQMYLEKLVMHLRFITLVLAVA